jgi:hypothetical protein
MKFSEILKQWPALDALLDEVLDLPLAERAQWLDRQTAVKPEQRAALDELLRLGEQAPSAPPVSLGDSWGSPVPSPCARDPGSRWYWPGWAGSMSLNGNSGQSIRPIFQQTRLP